MPITFSLGGRPVTLIDTPGFDDSERSDADILALVATYMAQSYQQGVLLTGIVFLQPINQTRLQGSEMRRNRLFKKLLGEDAYSRVVIATTMWDQVSEKEAAARQDQRRARNDVWGDMVSRGARVVRHDNTQESATGILRSLTCFATPIELQIQRELADSGGRVALTSAGRQLDADLSDAISRLRDEIEELRRERADTVEEMRALKARVASYEAERANLKSSDVSSSLFLSLPFSLSSSPASSLKQLPAPATEMIPKHYAGLAQRPPSCCAASRSGTHAGMCYSLTRPLGM